MRLPKVMLMHAGTGNKNFVMWSNVDILSPVLIRENGNELPLLMKVTHCLVGPSIITVVLVTIKKSFQQLTFIILLFIAIVISAWLVINHLLVT